MKRLILALTVTATLLPEFSLAQVRTTEIGGRWNLASVTCFKDHKTYPAKGWALIIDSERFSSEIDARCMIKYSLNYKLETNQIHLSPGTAFQNCNGAHTVIPVDSMSISYQTEPKKLWLILNNSYCQGLARPLDQVPLSLLGLLSRKKG